MTNDSTLDDCKCVYEYIYIYTSFRLKSIDEQQITYSHKKKKERRRRRKKKKVSNNNMTWIEKRRKKIVYNKRKEIMAFMPCENDVHIKHLPYISNSIQYRIDDSRK